MAVCVVIQCFVVAGMLRILHIMERRRLIKPTIPRSSLVLIIAMLIMFAGNLVQMAVWAEVFIALGEFDDLHTAFYHSAVNFTTLGYGDIVMSEGRRVLGGLEAANGVLMFGLTTSVLFSAISTLRRKAREEKASSP